MKQDHCLVGIHVQDRHGDVPNIQAILSEYGCSIKTRLGLHHVSENYCSPAGIIILETAGPQAEIDAMVARLKAVEGIDVQTMVFTHTG